jgi:hypothetical protein
LIDTYLPTAPEHFNTALSALIRHAEDARATGNTQELVLKAKALIADAEHIELLVDSEREYIAQAKAALDDGNVGHALNALSYGFSPQEPGA